MHIIFAGKENDSKTENSVLSNVVRKWNVPINLHRFDLLDYYVENFADEIEEDEDEDVKTKLKNFVDDDEDNNYKCLNVECLIEAVSSLNIKLLKILLPKFFSLWKITIIQILTLF